MANLKVELKPSKEIFDYLIGELDKYKFAHNILQPHDRERIVESFFKNGFAVLLDDEKPIGFTVWKRYLNSAEIMYKWIMPSYRGKHIGKEFGRIFNRCLLRKRIYNLVVQPATDYGHGMAASFGYKEIKDTPYRGSRSYWYLFNKKGRKPLPDADKKGYVLKLWENEYSKYKGDDPLECYRLDEKLNRTPILTVTDSDAPVQLVKDGVVIKETRVKYFFSEKEFQYFGLLYISTPLPKFLEIHNLPK